jgi:endoglucanase
MMKTAIFICLIVISFCNRLQSQDQPLKLNDKEYFEKPGLNVMVFQDIYPEGHQGGLGIIQNGVRIATNGDLRLEPTPGQWAPIPKMQNRIVDKVNNEIRVTLTFPDSARDRKGFNPIIYPSLYFNYIVKVRSENNAIIVTVDLDRQLPKEWYGKVGFNFELFPTILFGKSWMMGNSSGIFPRQSNGPVQLDDKGEVQPVPYGKGKKLVIAAENDEQRMTIESFTGDLQLLDGRSKHNNGWFVVRSLVQEGTLKEAIKWVITPYVTPGWHYKPVVQISQIGYHPQQQKIAIIETDKSDQNISEAVLYKIADNGEHQKILVARPTLWDGKFLRYQYYKFDFSRIQEEGMYFIAYDTYKTNPFRIANDVYQRHVWQPVLEYFLPIQMCHMRVNEKYRVWHGLCHMDDAQMAPVDMIHIDGYLQGPSTLTKYKPLEHVPGLNVGGWHDAGDDDLRVESQAGEAYILSLAYEAFKVNEDNTSIDENNHLVEINQPDGKNDILQQIQHGVLSVVAGYKNLGRLYRGIISPTLSQYVLMGDVSNQTDNFVYSSKLKRNERNATETSVMDDRLVFTEKNPSREFETSANLAGVARVLKGFDDPLSRNCLNISEELWKITKNENKGDENEKIHAAIELFITTAKPVYKDYIITKEKMISDNIGSLGWIIGKALPVLNNKQFEAKIKLAVQNYSKTITAEEKETPYGVPYRPHIWGAGWDIQSFGVRQYFLHNSFPEIVPKEYMLNALNFVLGCHPGDNTSSFASGVGARSMTTAYGYNRADYAYIPGGVVSGTALIRPDFPELKDFPFLWQQGEYVLGGGSSNYMFLVLAADKELNSKK